MGLFDSVHQAFRGGQSSGQLDQQTAATEMNPSAASDRLPVQDGRTGSIFEAGETVGLEAAAGVASSETSGSSTLESSIHSPTQSASTGNRFQSSYADRIRQTPSFESNRWAGERGESVCVPQSDEVRQIMEERGISGVQYQNGVPDFSPFSESTVKLGYMTDARHSQGLSVGRDGKDTVYAYFEDGKLVSRSHHADNGSMADLHMKYDKPGNFEQADVLTAEQWTANGRDGKEWTANDVAQYRQDHGLTWHECNDRETMQMIPEAINADFGHLGGVGEVKETQRIVEEALRDYDEGQMVEEEDYDRMSSEELDAIASEHGYYTDDGVWIPDQPDSRDAAPDDTDEETLADEQASDQMEDAVPAEGIDQLEQAMQDSMPEDDNEEAIIDDPTASEPEEQAAEEAAEQGAYDEFADEQAEEDYSDLADESAEDTYDNSDYSDLADDAAEDYIDNSIDYSDMADDIDSDSYDDSSFDSSDASFDGGGDSVE